MARFRPAEASPRKYLRRFINGFIYLGAFLFYLGLTGFTFYCFKYYAFLILGGAISIILIAAIVLAAAANRRDAAESADGWYQGADDLDRSPHQPPSDAWQSPDAVGSKNAIFH
jgi:hypothetical protein